MRATFSHKSTVCSPWSYALACDGYGGQGFSHNRVFLMRVTRAVTSKSNHLGVVTTGQVATQVARESGHFLWQLPCGGTGSYLWLSAGLPRQVTILGLPRFVTRDAATGAVIATGDISRTASRTIIAHPDCAKQARYSHRFAARFATTKARTANLCWYPLWYPPNPLCFLATSLRATKP
jgi:hypothetical protein